MTSLMLIVLISSLTLTSVSTRALAATTASSIENATNHVGITFTERTENDTSTTDSNAKTNTDFPKTGEKSSMVASMVGILFMIIFMVGVWGFNGSKKDRLDK